MKQWWFTGMNVSPNLPANFTKQQSPNIRPTSGGGGGDQASLPPTSHLPPPAQTLWCSRLPSRFTFASLLHTPTSVALIRNRPPQVTLSLPPSLSPFSVALSCLSAVRNHYFIISTAMPLLTPFWSRHHHPPPSSLHLPKRHFLQCLEGGKRVISMQIHEPVVLP